MIGLVGDRSPLGRKTPPTTPAPGKGGALGAVAKALAATVKAVGRMGARQ